MGLPVLPVVDRGTWRGATLLSGTRRVFPLVSVRLVFQGGAAWDPPGKEGLATLTARMLERGTRTRGHSEVIDAIETIGASFSANAGYEAIRLEGLVLTRSLDRFLSVLAEMVLEPAFSEEELETCREEMIAELALHREEDRDLGESFFRRAIYGEGPYGRFSEGTAKSLPTITREDVLQRWREGFATKRLIAAAAGDIDLAQLTAALEKHFGRLPEGAPAVRPPAVTRPLDGLEVLLVDKPERTQTQIFVGRNVVPPTHPDYLPFLLANHAFGGMFTSRLMQEVRVKRGWSYGAYSRLEMNPDGALAGAWTFPANDDTIPAIRLLLDLLGAFARDGVTAEELEAARGHLQNVLAFEVETPEQAVARRVHETLLGLPDDWTPRWLDRIEKTPLAEANAAARRVLDAGSLALTVVCTADRFRGPLQELPQVKRIRVVPFDADDPSAWTDVFSR